MSPNTRKKLYKLGKALAAVLAVYGIVSGEEAASLLLVFAALLDLADRNVDNATRDVPEIHNLDE